MRNIPKLVVLVGIALHLLQRGRQEAAPVAFQPVAEGLYRSVRTNGRIVTCQA